MNTPQVIIFHGTGAAPSANWFPWLQHELEERGIGAAVPAFPTPEHQSWACWRELFYDQFQYLTPGMILVGHSVGCAMILRLLEESHHAVRRTFLTAGWTGLLSNPEFDPLIHSFCDGSFDWEQIRAQAGKVMMFHGDDDPYVPLARAQELAHHLGAALEVLAGGGHLNLAAGYNAFPELLEAILEACAQ